MSPRATSPAPPSAARPAFARFEMPPAVARERQPDWPLAACAQHVVLTHFRRLLSLRQAAWEGDPDSIRRLRVAARRVRTALKTFASLWPQEMVQTTSGQLDRLARELGRGRDYDTLLAFCDEQARQHPDDGSIAAAAARLRQRRQSTLATAQRALSEFELSGTPALVLTWFAATPVDLWRFVTETEGEDGEAVAWS